MIHPMAGQVLGWLAWVPLEYVIRLVQLFSQVPGSTLSVPAFSGLLVWAYYGVLALLILMPGGPSTLWSSVRRLVARWQEGVPLEGRAIRRLGSPKVISLVVAGGLFVVVALIWFYAVTGPDGRLHVHFLDVGQGDSVLIVTPEGRQILVDGGPAPGGAARAVGSRTAFWDRDLDLVVLTHPDEDHFRGLVAVLGHYGVDVVLEGGGVSENPLYQEWQTALDEEETRRITAFRGQTIVLDTATRLEVLNPPRRPIKGTGSDLNNNAVVLRLEYGRVSFLLTADIEAEAEQRLLQDGLNIRSNVFKVPHHGSKTSTTSRFLSTVSPVAAVISAGAGNPYGHPHPVVTGRLEDLVGKDRTYLTAERGDIEFITDGKRLWVKTGR